MSVGSEMRPPRTFRFVGLARSNADDIKSEASSRFIWDSAAPYAFLASAALIYDSIMVPRYVGHLFLQLGKIQVSEHM